MTRSGFISDSGHKEAETEAQGVTILTDNKLEQSTNPPAVKDAKKARVSIQSQKRKRRL
jgi:hypothetical protein